MEWKARLYLDVDECLNANNPDPDWGEVARGDVFINHGGGYRSKFKFVWAPALVVALDALRTEFDVELVWLSSWCEDLLVTRKLAPMFNGLRDGRVLNYRDGVGSGLWKPESLLADQRGDKMPFIWVDDFEVPAYGDMVAEQTPNTPSLLLAPYVDVGLTPADTAAMRTFLTEH